MPNLTIAKFLAAIGSAEPNTVVALLNNEAPQLTNQERFAFAGYVGHHYGVSREDAMEAFHNLGVLPLAVLAHLEVKVAEFEGREPVAKAAPAAIEAPVATNEAIAPCEEAAVPVEEEPVVEETAVEEELMVEEAPEDTPVEVEVEEPASVFVEEVASEEE